MSGESTQTWRWQRWRWEGRLPVLHGKCMAKVLPDGAQQAAASDAPALPGGMTY